MTASPCQTITIDKTTTTATYSAVNDPIDYSFFFNDTATTEIYTLSLHDALPICPTCPDTSLGLAPGASITCTGTYLVTQTDLNNGSVTNVENGRAHACNPATL